MNRKSPDSAKRGALSLVHSKKVVHPATRSQKMPPRLRAVPEATRSPQAQKQINATASQIRKLLHGLGSRELSTLYEVAVLVRERQADASYGEAAVELLAAELTDLGLSAKTLRNYALVAERFDRKAFDELASRTGGPAKKPFRLSWSHVVMLAEIKDGRTRRRILNFALEGHSVDDCRRELAGATAAGSASRPNAIQAVAIDIERIVNKETRLEEAVSALVAKPTHAGTEELVRMVNCLARLSDFATRQVARCQALLTARGDHSLLPANQQRSHEYGPASDHPVASVLSEPSPVVTTSRQLQPIVDQDGVSSS